MIESEKGEFYGMLDDLTNIPLLKVPVKITPETVSMYWRALEHRTLNDVKFALNRHIQDPDRGRFFPVPADIAAQLPSEADIWLTADEAWATCPKDENSSSAMCEEIAGALSIATDLIGMGDMIAARRAFIDHYNRLIEDAKRNGQKPAWFSSYGHDKDGRYTADIQVIERNNLMLPMAERKLIPVLEDQSTITVAQLIHKAADKIEDREFAMKNLDFMKGKLGIKK